jgi:hypothetical protein
MKALSLALLLLVSLTHAAPKRLANFEALMKAAKAGENLRLVIEYAKTEIEEEGKRVKAPDAIGGMSASTFEYFAPGVVRNRLAYVATSETHLIQHPRHGHVYNYVRLRLYADETVEITAQYLKPTTFEIVMNQTYYGRISNGKDAAGVHLFRS